MNNGLKRNLIWVLAALVFLCACAQQYDPDDQPAKAPHQALPPGALRLTTQQQSDLGVQVGQVRLANVPPSFTIAATLTVPPAHQAPVTAPVSGYVEDMRGNLAPGMHVHAGELLASLQQVYSSSQRVRIQINARQADTEVAAAQAQVKLAQADVERYQKLYRDNIAPLKQVQQAQAQLVQAQAALEAARSRAAAYQAAASQRAQPSNPGRFALRAPISGVLSSLQLAPGALINAGQVIATVVRLDPIWVQVPLPQQELGQFEKARAGVLTTSAFPGKRFAMRRVASAAVIDPATHTLSMLFAVANSAGKLRPGMTAMARIEGEGSTAAASVPSQALVSQGTQTFLFTAQSGGLFQQLPVQVKYSSGDTAVLAQGPAPGTSIAVRGAALLESTLQRQQIQGAD